MPDPIDPLDLILNHELNLEEVTESEVKELKEDGHEDSDETGSIDSGGSIEEMDPMEVYENITQDVPTDNQENSDKNGSMGSNDSAEENIELIPEKEKKSRRFKKKLGRVLKYLMNTKDMFLTMEANDIK